MPFETSEEKKGHLMKYIFGRCQTKLEICPLMGLMTQPLEKKISNECRLSSYGNFGATDVSFR